MAIKIVTQTSRNDYLYADILLDLTTTVKNQSNNIGDKTVAGNDIAISKDLSAITNSIKNLFNTSLGEIILSPEFGLPLYKYIGEPLTTNTATNIGMEIDRALTRWEPRITINKIYIQPIPDNNMFHLLLDLSVPSIKEELKIAGSIDANRMQIAIID